MNELAKEAIDIIAMKRKVKAAEKEEQKHAISNVDSDDSLAEIVFKMFEQVKAYNARLSELQVYQKDLKADLKALESYSYMCCNRFIEGL